MYTIPRTGCRLGGAPTSTSATARRCRQSSSSSSVKTRRFVPSSSSSSRSLFFPKLNAFSSSSSLRLSIGRTSATATGENNRARERRQKEEVERRQLSLRKKNFSRSRSRRTAAIRTNSLLRFGGGGFQQQTLFAPEALFVIAALSAIVIATTAMIKRVFKTNGEMSDKRKKVVVIGGGFAGMQAVFDLAKTCDVTLVDTKAYFEYTPGALSAMLGGGPMRRYKGSGHSGERIGKLHRSYEKMCARVGASFAHVADDGVKCVCEEYVSVRMAGREEDEENKKLAYDYLIIATGSNYGGGAPGIKPMGGTPGEGAKTGYARQKTFQRDAERVATPSSRKNINNNNNNSIGNDDEREKTTLIVGGGVVGVELAADIACVRAKGKRTTTSVVLAHDKNRLLDTLPKSASEYVEKWFERKNVRVELGQRFERINGDESSPTSSYVGSKNKTVKIEANETVFAVGSKPSTNFLSFENPSALLSVAEAKKNNERILEIPLSKLGYIERDPKTLQVIGFENIYAVGDCAMKPPGQFLASFAHWEAEYVATRIKRGRKHAQKKQQEYSLPPRFMAISLGPWNGLFLWGNLVLCKGVLAAIVKFLVELWFSNFFPAPYALLRRLPKFEFSSSNEDEGGEKIQSSFGKSSLGASSS
jgi:NADH dehydrogenase FAD-containing subunit